MMGRSGRTAGDATRSRNAPIDLTDFYGVKGLLVVEETDSGSTRVGTFLKSD